MSRPKQQTDGDGRLVESFRNDRLEVLRRQVEDGSYHVSERHVASAMVRRGVAQVIAQPKRQG
jgi:anti-sigma28 factor (negative regulator of flagellin synthesis)